MYQITHAASHSVKVNDTPPHTYHRLNLWIPQFPIATVLSHTHWTNCNTPPQSMPVNSWAEWFSQTTNQKVSLNIHCSAHALCTCFYLTAHPGWYYSCMWRRDERTQLRLRAVTCQQVWGGGFCLRWPNNVCSTPLRLSNRAWNWWVDIDAVGVVVADTGLQY